MSIFRLITPALPAIFVAGALIAVPAAHASSKKSTTSATTTSAPATTTPATTATTAPKTSSSKLPANEEFTSVALAQAHCSGDTVVWSTLSKSKSFHVSTSKYYGKTKHGAYVCEKDALSAGFHASKS